MARGAWAEGRAAFERAVAQDPTADALEGLGWANYWLDNIEESMALRERACRAFRDNGQCREAARVATAVGLDAFDLHGVAVATGWLELARRCLEGLEPCSEHGWLVLWEGHIARMLHGDTEQARRLGAEAAEIGRSFRLADLEVLGSALEGLAMVNDGDVSSGMRQLDASMAAVLVGEMNDLYSVAQACCFLLHACEWVRDYDRMAQWTARVDDFAGNWNINSVFTACRTQHAAMLIGQGRWAEAETQLLSLNEQLLLSRPWFASDGIEQLGELRRRQGRSAEAAELFQKAGARTIALLGRAQIALDRGQPAEALDLAERALRGLSAARWTDASIGLFVKVRAQLGLGEVDAAKELVSELMQAAKKVETGFSTGLAHHAEGLIAAHAQDHPRASVHFADAIVAFEAARAPYEAARVRVDMARAQFAQGRGGSAGADLDAAVSAFEDLGAKRDVETAEALRAESSIPPEPAGTVKGISPRERQVLKLVAEGLNDRAIAGDLGISEHTVHRHISNILTKFDTPTRAAAVAFALRQDLL
jgi:DNA-binding CsgD family transcriptional regulator